MPNMANAPLCLGIDLGGTKIHVLAVANDGSVVASARCRTGGEAGYDAVIARVGQTADEVAAKVGRPLRDFDGIGVGVPGPVDDARGVMLMAPNLGWRDRPIADDLSRRCERAVVVGNDVNFGALGEVHHGAARGVASACAAFVGTGLGGAVIIDGRVVNGRHGFAGEFGHIPSPFGDILCGCGQRACLETVASKTGVGRLVAEAVAAGRPTLLQQRDEKLRSSEIRSAWDHGCPVVREAVSSAARALAWGLSAIGNVIDPEAFILGGGFVKALGERLLPQVRDGMAAYSVLYQRNPADLRVSSLGDDSVAIGAAVAARAASTNGAEAVAP
jgi:glucokinase